MRKITWLLVLFVTGSVFKVYSQQNADLDTTFNFNGKAYADFNGGHDMAATVLIQPDGKILVAGSTFNGTDYNFALARFEINGSLDNTFGIAGTVTTNFAPGSDFITSIALQPDGKIIAGGAEFTGFWNDFALMRYNANGSPDQTFGTNGKVFTHIGNGDADISAVLIQPDGKIVAAGICTTPGSSCDFGMVRYNKNGTMDISFGVNGVVTTDFSGLYDFPHCAGLQTDGKILVGGAAGAFPIYDFGLVRYDSLGNLDNTFGVNGKVTTDFGNADESAASLAIQNDGKIVLAGYSGSPYNIALARYTTTGSLDTGFNTTGKIINSFTSHDEGHAVVIQSDNKIIVAGVSYNGADQNFCILRYTGNGTLDSTFSNDGYLTTDFGTFTDKANAVALQADGKIVAAGVAQYDFAISRYLADLSTGIIDFATMTNSLFIYPNPVKQNAVLTYSLNQTENISIRLMDMGGKLIKTLQENQKQLSGTYSKTIIFPENLTSGFYYILISNGTHKLSIKIMN